MTDRRMLARLGDAELAAALSDLGERLEPPSPVATADDPARRARLAIEAGRGGRRRSLRPWLPGRGPLRRSLVLAVAAILAVAAVAGAIGFGLPGIRIVFAPPPQSSGTSPATSGGGSPGPTSSPLPSAAPTTSFGSPGSGVLGSGLGLGTPIAVADASAETGLPIRMPPDPPYGPPVAAWSLDRRLSLVWPTSRELPAMREPGIGLILAQFRGSIDPGFFEKILQPGTRIEAVVVDEGVGWWISGDPHELIFLSPSGEPVFDSHRIVGDTLIWARGEVTYRLESGLDRTAAVALAESLR